MHFFLFKCFWKKTMVSGIYFIFQLGKNKIQMYTHKIKIQPNNVYINYCINKTWFSKSVSPKKRWVPQTKSYRCQSERDKESTMALILTWNMYGFYHNIISQCWQNKISDQGHYSCRLGRFIVYNSYNWLVVNIEYDFLFWRESPQM